MLLFLKTDANSLTLLPLNLSGILIPSTNIVQQKGYYVISEAKPKKAKYLLPCSFGLLILGTVLLGT